MTAWLALAAREDRQHGGNDGYEDDPSSFYSCDDTVANHASVRQGDQIVLGDKRTLLDDRGDRRRPLAEAVPFMSAMSEGRHQAAQDHAAAFSLQRVWCQIDDPDTETREVVTYRSRHDVAWVDLGGNLAAPELRAVCMSRDHS
jgi:hypothetical protein